MNPSMVKINEFIYLTFLSKEQITDLQGSCDDGCVVLELEENIVQSECDLLLHKMQHFSKRIRRALEQNPGHQIILCRDRASPMDQEEVVLFLGGFLVLSEHWSADEAASTFQSLSNKIIRVYNDSSSVDNGATCLDCWQALEHARRLGWMDWARGTDEDEQPLHVGELAHYASPVNGAVHCVAPGRLLVFPDPAVLPDGVLWSDDSSEPPVRRFAAAFYADLLRDLGVSTVARLAPAPRTDPATATLGAAGLAAFDLAPPSASQPSPLRALDGLVSLSRAAAGAVALHPGDGDASWPAHAGGVVAAYLVSREGFSGTAAHAWLALVCPALVGGRPAPPA